VGFPRLPLFSLAYETERRAQAHLRIYSNLSPRDEIHLGEGATIIMHLKKQRKNCKKEKKLLVSGEICNQIRKLIIFLETKNYCKYLTLFD
jgi:superfamily II DNA/RNA helicase